MMSFAQALPDSVHLWADHSKLDIEFIMRIEL